MKVYRREELIEICEDAVVPCENWDNRDSYSAQVNIQSIYALLKANVKYVVYQEDETLWIEFGPITKEDVKECRKYYLGIDSIDDYFNLKDVNNEEMFYAYGLSISNENIGEKIRMYMPTRKRLQEVSGKDWY